MSIEGAEGSNFDDTLLGDAEPNFFISTPGDDLMDGRGGVDRVSFCCFFPLPEAPINANLELGTATGHGTDTLVSIEALSGSVLDDVLTGDDGANFLDGGEGNDILNGGGGPDFLGCFCPGGESGDDILNGGDGNDVLEGGPGNDVLDGGAGFDTAHFFHAPGPINANLATGVATGDGIDTLIAIEELSGSQFDDTLVGDHLSNTINGNDGNDFLDGGPAVDFLNGGPGNDSCVAGDDTLVSCETIL